MIPPVDLTSCQLDENGRSKNALFLPALSSFYTAMLGREEEIEGFIAPGRIPVGFEHGIQGLNFQRPTDSYFYYKWCLYSAGHATIDVNKVDPKENMVRNRDRKTSFILGDSGGFQIGKGVWDGDWDDPKCPKAQKKREQVLTWLDTYMDYGMILDIPVWSCHIPEVREKIGINSFKEAVVATKINNDYFIKHRSPTGCKLLNVLQGETHDDAETWYQEMKDYCDPAVYPDTHFNGWSMGGQNATDPHLILNRLVRIIYDGLLKEGKQDWVHFLGLGKMPWACFLTDVQRAIRKYHNPAVTLSMDAASPFLTTANGGCYINSVRIDRGRWSVYTDSCVDDKKYATDTRSFGEVIQEDKGYKTFEESAISLRMMGKDICCYQPGDLNKIGKEGKTSWDSLSYCLLMGHNVYCHIDSIQKSIEEYDAGKFPKALIDERFETITFRDVVEEIFSAKTRDEALAIVEHHSSLWTRLSGSRGNKGTKAINAHSMFNSLFSIQDDTLAVTDDEEIDPDTNENIKEEEMKLDNLEHLFDSDPTVAV